MPMEAPISSIGWSFAAWAISRSDFMGVSSRVARRHAPRPGRTGEGTPAPPAPPRRVGGRGTAYPRGNAHRDPRAPRRRRRGGDRAPRLACARRSARRADRVGAPRGGDADPRVVLRHRLARRAPPRPPEGPGPARGRVGAAARGGAVAARGGAAAPAAPLPRGRPEGGYPRDGEVEATGVLVVCSPAPWR